MRNTFFLNYLAMFAIVLLATAHCGGDPFAGDSYRLARHDVVFKAEDLKDLIGRDESELSQIFSPGPNQGFTYLNPRTKTLLGRTFEFDRLYFFKNLGKSYINSPGVSGYDGREFIRIAVFCLNGKVIRYFVRHQILDENSVWQPGPHDSGQFGSNGVWPGAMQDISAYHDQFPDRNGKPPLGPNVRE